MEDKKVYYVMPNGGLIPAEEVESRGHFGDNLATIVKLVPGINKHEVIIYNEALNDCMEEFPDLFFEEIISQYDQTDGIYSSVVTWAINRRSVPMIPKKKILNYSTPSSNTHSKYWVRVDVENEEYKRSFIVEVPTVNLTAIQAMENAVEKLGQMVEDGQIPYAFKDEYGSWNLSMTTDKGKTDEITFDERNKYDKPFFYRHIVGLSIQDFFMTIDGYEYDPETREIIREKTDADSE